MRSLINRVIYFFTKKALFILYVLFISGSINETYGQHNFIGKTETYIINYFSNDTLYSLKTDTIDRKTKLLTFRPKNQYPFYTYEIDLRTDFCISYGMVSKNIDVLNTYLSMLEFLGEKIESDPANTSYRVQSNKGIYCYYYIKQPYLNSKVESKKRIFYILVSPEN